MPPRRAPTESGCRRATVRCAFRPSENARPQIATLCISQRMAPALLFPISRNFPAHELHGTAPQFLDADGRYGHVRTRWHAVTSHGRISLQILVILACC